MRIAVIAVFAALLTGCGSREASTAEAKHGPAPEAAKKKAGEIRLSTEAQRNAGIEIQKVEPRSVSETISATGQLTVNEDQTWSVGALMDGRVVSVSAKVGDHVKGGQVLARIHSHDVHDARAAYRTAEAELARAESAEVLARRIRDRARRLLELKSASLQEAESAQADLRNAETAVRNAKIALGKERTHIVEFLDVPIDDNDSRDENDFVPVKAPAAGIVLDRYATPGTVVATGDPVFRITSTSSLWMTANVNESDLGQLRPGQAVRILVRAFPERPFSGRILRLGEQLDPTTRTLQVRVAVPNPGNLLKPEMYATAAIDRGRTRQALFIPEGAVQELNGARVVFIRTAVNQFEPRPVETARILNGSMEVTSGLKPGDQIVVKGSFILKSQLLKSSLEEE